MGWRQKVLIGISFVVLGFGVLFTTVGTVFYGLEARNLEASSLAWMRSANQGQQELQTANNEKTAAEQDAQDARISSEEAKKNATQQIQEMRKAKEAAVKQAKEMDQARIKAEEALDKLQEQVGELGRSQCYWPPDQLVVIYIFENSTLTNAIERFDVLGGHLYSIGVISPRWMEEAPAFHHYIRVANGDFLLLPEEGDPNGWRWCPHFNGGERILDEQVEAAREARGGKRLELVKAR